jgi:hypothetical protein
LDFIDISVNGLIDIRAAGFLLSFHDLDTNQFTDRKIKPPKEEFFSG